MVHVVHVVHVVHSVVHNYNHHSKVEGQRLKKSDISAIAIGYRHIAVETLKIITKRAVVMVKKEGRIFQKLLEREPFFPIRASPGAHAQRKKETLITTKYVHLKIDDDEIYTIIPFIFYY